MPTRGRRPGATGDVHRRAYPVPPMTLIGVHGPGYPVPPVTLIGVHGYLDAAPRGYAGSAGFPGAASRW